GRLLNGDELLAIFAHDLLDRQPQALILGDVKCSDRLFADIQQRGGQALMCVTGHSVVKAKMLETHAPLAGELSGHMFFAEQWYGFDDAIYAAARLLDYLTRIDSPLTALPGWPAAFSTREIQIPCPDQHKTSVVNRAQKHFGALYPTTTVDGARITFPHGWGLVRASNTQPVLVLRFEADSPEHLAVQQSELTTLLDQWIAEAR
ncbi:MAG: phosphomannomutase, partial [Desulfovibrionaceae bacterium]